MADNIIQLSKFQKKKPKETTPSVDPDQLLAEIKSLVNEAESEFDALKWALYPSKAESPNSPDFMIARRNGWHMGMAVFVDDGKLEEKSEWIEALKAEGYLVAECKSKTDFIEKASIYLDGSYNDWGD